MNGERASVEKDGKRSDWALMLLAALGPLLCCGLPAIIAGLAAASLAIKGAVGGALVLLVVGGGSFLAYRAYQRRRGEACCAPGETAARKDALEVGRQMRLGQNGSSAGAGKLSSLKGARS